MRHPRRIAWALAIALMATTISAVGGSAAQATSTCPTTVLGIGQHIVADTACSQFKSFHGHFILYVFDDSLEMDQMVRGTGQPAGVLDVWTGPTWRQGTYDQISHRQVALTLRRDGNLVLLTPTGRVIWATNTAGSGATHAIISDAGRLGLYTSSGKRVWASNSGIYALGGSDRVRPGTHLMQSYNGWADHRWADGTVHFTRYSDVSLAVMQTNGDFVARCQNSTRVFWHTNTHTPGSYLKLLESGALVVESPSGRVLWSSPTRGWRDAWSTMGTQVSSGTTHFWYARGANCQ